MEKLFLGVAREKITPAVGCQLYGYTPDTFSESLNDDLTATAFYFRQGNTQALMVSLTVCLIQTALDADIRKMLEEKLGIPAGHCMLCATHTHSGPNTAGTTGWGEIDREYCDTVFVPQILSAAEKAVAAAQPVKIWAPPVPIAWWASTGASWTLKTGSFWGRTPGAPLTRR